MLPALSEVREWNSDTGTVVQAEFVSVTDDIATLKTVDERVIEVPISRLSEIDRDYITSQTKPKIESAISERFGISRNMVLIVIVSLLVIFLVSGLILIIRAFKQSLLWGLGYIFIPFVSLIFVITFWQDTYKVFLINLVSTLAFIYLLYFEGLLQQ